MIATCPPAERLHDFVLGKVPEQESDELYGHLAGCDSCQKQLETSASFDDSFVNQLQVDAELELCREEPALLLATDGAKDIAVLLNRRITGDLDSARAGDLADSANAELLPNTIGEYQIDRLLGRGGMGTVYLGHHTKLGRAVALKIIAGHRIADPRMQGRFAAEMKAVGRMNHPNIVVAHDAREIDGLAVLVTEYIDGLNVGSILRRTGPLTVADAARIASDVATALAAIDHAGLVHRDIKPSNIMISRTGQVKLLDLGLARLQNADGDPHDHTATGQALGTVDYVAPEQIHDGRNVDVRADIYALGCTLFKMLTGQAVFDDNQYPTSFAKMTAHVQAAPPSIAALAKQVPAPLVELVAEMLHKDPSHRPATPLALIERLARFTADANLVALVEHASTAEEKPRNPRKAAAERVQHSAPTRGSFFSNRVPWLIGLGFGGLLLGWAMAWMLGIEITIQHPDGTMTKLTVANGSSVRIDELGNATVVLPGASADPIVRATENPPAEALPTASQLSLEGIWKVRDKTNQIPFSFMVLRNGNFALVGDEQGEIKYGTFRHAPQNDHPAEIDLVLADNGKLITDLGYYQVSQPKPEKNPIAFFWFSNSGTTRPLLHTECEEQYEMEQVDTQIFRQSPVTSEMSQAWEIWQRLGNPSYSPASKPSPAAGLNSPTPTTPNQKANDESAVTAAEVALSQQNHGEEESAQDADQISHLIDPANVPLDGIWKFTTPNRFLGGFLVITNGQFAIVSGPKDEGELEGIWRYNSLTAPPIFDLEFTSGGPPDPQLGVYKLMQFHHHRSTKNSDGTHNLTPIATLQLTVAFGQPGKPRPTKIDGRADQLTLIQIDLSQVTGEQDLPDRLPVEVWRKWKTMTEPGTKSPMDDE